MNSESEIIILGGGIIGLALAIELKLRGTDVTVLSRNFQESAARVAAGMIAPQAERIPPSPMLELCLRSRDLYPEWTRKLESITGRETGYWQCGILSPAYEANGLDTAPCTSNLPARWLDRQAIHELQPGLGTDVAGGWWYPYDAQVDNRRCLVQNLIIAAQVLGVNRCEGVEVTEILQKKAKITGLQTNQGIIRGSHYILATGAWSGQLLPIPVYPKKGQMLSVKVPDSDDELPLKQVLYGTDTYIVPRRDGLIIIGATSENVGFTPEITPAGVQQLLANAMRLFPRLKDFPLQEFWWGYRPATPDDLPILGASPLENLTLATGHYRNGILLAPITAKLIADFVLSQEADPLLAYFHWERF
ncbi:MAG: glycine oxidase ThiO [Jaaginema sp. PMC 1079.18]|nr:glycine oxidase ThiO [Jaaginema sp. PMC 1080.18]MEC4852000.1 glycine oxidase ThiO [Jaaginema sp. PMC 1079.18]MEC4868201.1 glycine oxidase ThiO [Jaaginema sp. PMC 1078.18]